VNGQPLAEIEEVDILFEIERLGGPVCEHQGVRSGLRTLVVLEGAGEEPAEPLNAAIRPLSHRL